MCKWFFTLNLKDKFKIFKMGGNTFFSLLICSALISLTSAEFFFSQIDVRNVSKIKQIYCYFTENTSMDFRKVNTSYKAEP